MGNNQNPYAGTFDGQGHTISGLYFNERSPSYIGLFGSNSGTIKNVGVVDSYFYGHYNVGGVCGYNEAINEATSSEGPTVVTATIENCFYCSDTCKDMWGANGGVLLVKM